MIGEYKLNEIYNEDSYEAIKKIPDKSVDLIIIDPPYELETEGSKKNSISKSFANMNNDIKDLSKGIDLLILKDLIRILKKPNIYIWCNKKQILDYMKYFVDELGCSFEIMTWLKTNPTPLCGGNYLIDKEFCLYFRKGIKLNTKFETAFTYWISSKNKDDRDTFKHPTIKPLEIIKTLINNSSNENDIVADFFLGSGTTCVAAKELNRRYIGFEIDKEYYKIAKNRLNGITASGQMSIFTNFEEEQLNLSVGD
jgi:DNA modification methylase